MTKTRIISYLALWIFPLTVLLVYCWRMWLTNNEINLFIPGFTFFSTLAVMIMLELAFRYDKSVSQRYVLGRDIISIFVNTFVTRVVFAPVFAAIIIFLPELLFGRSIFFTATEQLGPFWLQFLLVLLLYSFLRYWVHRIQHIVPMLWNLHSYHHAVTDLKGMNVLLSHPVDFALRNVLPPVILGVVGFDPLAIVFGIGLLGTFSTFSHCGAGLHAGWLNKVFITPEVHRWHHSTVTPEGRKYAVNYGVGFALWDRLFSTYYLPYKDGVPEQPEKLGVPDGTPDEPNYLKLLFMTRFWGGKSRTSQVS